MSTATYDDAAARFDAVQERFLKGAAALLDDGPELDRLAALDRLQYDRERGAAAKKLGVRRSVLDQAVRDRRPDAPLTGRSREIHLPDPTPADEPVDGRQLADFIVSMITRYVVLPPHAADAVTLWILRAHAHDLFDVNPRLALLSPEKRCGKTTMLELLEGLVPRALLASNVTPAVLFRSIEAYKPSMLIDEMDSFSDADDELRGLINSGHRRASAYVLRTVGEDHEPRRFSTWCPMALAAISRLPRTIEDRSLIIWMHRRARSERVLPLRWAGRQGQALRDTLTQLARGCARWVRDHAEALRDAEPEAPAELNDRAADNWMPLLAIAELLGGAWVGRARQAALALSGGDGTDGEGVGVQVLADIRSLFESEDVSQFTSADLCAQLAALEERPWGEWRRGQPLSPAQLARLLRPFGISSRNVRQPNGSVLKGYIREDLDDAFMRYLPENPLSIRYPATCRSQSGDEPLFRNATEGAGSVSEKWRIPAPDAECSAVADPKREIECDEEIFEDDP